jgi:hypothetical protein
MNKEELLKKREIFFQDITEVMFREKSKINAIYDIEKYFVYPNKEDIFCDIKHGELIFITKSEYFGNPFEILLGVWQVGNKLKIGFHIKDKDQDLLTAIFQDEQSEFLYVFEDGKPNIKSIYGGVYYDWYFNAKDLYESYQNQETFIMNMRHLYLRVLNTIYNYYEKKNIFNEDN